MDSYEFQLLLGAVNYAGMYPSLLVAPWLWALMLFNVGLDNMLSDPAIVRSISAVFLLLLVVVAPPYFITLQYKYTNYISVTIFQRVAVVSILAAITAIIGQDPFSDFHNNFVGLMFVVDVGSGFAHGMAHPGGLSGVFRDIWTLSKNTPNTPFDKALRVEAYVGIAFGFMACVYTAVVAQIKAGLIITMLATFIIYFWIGFHANDPSETPTTFMLFHRVIVAAALSYLADVEGNLGGLILVFRIMTCALLAGVVSPYAGAMVTGVSSLFLYKLSSDYVLSEKSGEKAAFYWMLGWGVVTIVSSYVWIYLFIGQYDEKQKKRVWRTNWQDRILGVFCFLAGAALDKAGFLLPGTLGAPVVYLLPPVTVWFTLETKMLNHMQVGTPFHPTWWINGDLPKFSHTDWVNATFGIATALITVILTSYAFYGINTAIGFVSLNPYKAESSWKFAMAHGILYIFHSGMWMIIASSGIPPVGKAKAWQTFPPPLPAPLQANPHDCVPMHKVDLFIGNALLFAATFLIWDDEYDRPLKAAVGLAWIITNAMKIDIHVRGWGYVAPVLKQKKVNGGTKTSTASSLPPVVFIHGWKASVLADKNTGKNEFDYTMGTLLGLTRDPKLELPLEWDARGNQVKDNLLATEPCHSARFCGIKIGGIYGPMLDHLEKTRDLRTFAYDWRRPLGETAGLFQEFLANLRDECGQAPQVIAHSMGCLVTLSVLNKRPELFHSILFGAAAFSPNVSILKDFSLVGEKNVVVKNSTMFSPMINVSNPAPFHFLALPGEREQWGKPHVDVFWDENNKSMQYDLHNVETWKRLKCGIYHPDSAVKDLQRLHNWLQSVLDKARTFREGLIPANSGLKASDCPPICVLRGDYEDTEFGYYFSLRNGVDFKENITHLRGDGRITLEDALPPKDIPLLKVVTNDRDHSQVLNDLDNVSMLLARMLSQKK